MSPPKDKSRFHLSSSAAAFVGNAKVSTDTAQDNAVQHSTEPPKPWEDLSAGAKGINFTPSPELYAMMVWCKNNAPGGISFLEILRQGADMKCRELIAKHYKPDGD